MRALVITQNFKEEVQKMFSHKVSIAVKNPGLKERQAILAAEKKIHKKFLRWLLGEELNILVISPGASVRTVEVREIRQDD